MKRTAKNTDSTTGDDGNMELAGDVVIAAAMGSTNF